MEKPGLFASNEEKELYWNWWLETQKVKLEDSKDSVTRNLIELVELAVACNQYRFEENEFEDVPRVVRLNIKLPRANIEKYFGVKTYSLYGVGLFTVVEGLMLSPTTRESLGYDTWKESTCINNSPCLDFACIPSQLRRNHRFDLVTPAMTGLFVPKESPMMDWVRANWAIQYFDLLN